MPQERRVKTWNNSIVQHIEASEIFPVVGKASVESNDRNSVQDIILEEIFPCADAYSFENIVVSRKVNSYTPVSNHQSVRPPRAYPGIVDINFENIFPNSSINKQICAKDKMNSVKPEKSREEVMAEREAKKAAKAAAKSKGKGQPKQQPAEVEPPPLQKSSTDTSISEKLSKLHISDQQQAVPKPPQAVDKPLSKAERKALFETQNPGIASKAEIKPSAATTKAERRAKQEAQRAAKADAQAKKVTTTVKVKNEPPTNVPKANKEASPVKIVKKSSKTESSRHPQQQPHMVKLFNHLYSTKFQASEFVNSAHLHPAITKLGLQYAEGIMAGSKARCLAFLKALAQVIQDYETPPEKEFSRGFEEALNPNIAHLQKCRPFSVSMTNALKYIKMHNRQLNAKDSDSTQKELLLDAVNTYVSDQIEKAEEAISISVQQKIYDGDVILTYGCSSLIKHILEEANRREKSFRVVIVDSRPRNREHEMLRQLVAQGIDCTCVLINAISYVMPEVTKVLLSAHALLANGCVMSRIGTAQIALVAKSYNVPVLVCCETHKFSERVQTDAFVYNEIGNPNDLVLHSGTRDNLLHNPLAEWESISKLTPLNLHYDVTPPELVTAVVTEVAILPCTSVPVILRIKPSEVGY